MPVGWLFPAWGGTSPLISQRDAWKSSIESIASSNEVCTHFPSPVISRSRSATRMPWARKIPEHRSAIGMPTRTGPWPGMPVMDMRPPMPWAI